ncbi:hypothetical protein K505DRAFT_341948 [Melanomma pulvis-pyrius CBS 109.77]|uniref:Uncharacterized protein n=1 Tax=Melanomma pulvis-pyrius CBS 109.77 TaxID=1314802 RepID=A0A6A6WWX3_9PLEO|nr:hypothetical protein K505DRAFT_341948 [Melanomma pulvis-pyrius CBS 109.77]
MATIYRALIVVCAILGSFLVLSCFYPWTAIREWFFQLDLFENGPEPPRSAPRLRYRYLNRLVSTRTASHHLQQTLLELSWLNSLGFQRRENRSKIGNIGLTAIALAVLAQVTGFGLTQRPRILVTLAQSITLVGNFVFHALTAIEAVYLLLKGLSSDRFMTDGTCRSLTRKNEGLLSSTTLRVVDKEVAKGKTLGCLGVAVRTCDRSTEAFLEPLDATKITNVRAILGITKQRAYPHASDRELGLGYALALGRLSNIRSAAEIVIFAQSIQNIIPSPNSREVLSSGGDLCADEA